ncbi:MAG: glycoside hydrolase [Verrucomicrobia bacterium]|nr:MAG: glycoside hydrolase [Verrucomicrobiota bacterium]
MNRRKFLHSTTLAGAALATGQVHAAPKFADASWQSLPRWRGFNLLEKFIRGVHDAPFEESDFDIIAEWGFNFVRLPCDYRIWTEAPGHYREAPLKEIDRAIRLGRERGIHVLLNLHRAPGYTVAKPQPEKLDLWADDTGGEEARRQFAAQWQMFAERYRGIPSRELSFNLVNEPPRIPAEKYIRACAAAVEAIHRADPDRLVLADGLEYGHIPVPELKALRIGQCTRGYDPIQLSHYRADWIKGSKNYPLPTWPMLTHPTAFLCGNLKKDLQSPLILQGNFPAGTKLALHLTRLSASPHLVIKADGQTLLQRSFATTPENHQPEVTDVLETELSATAQEISIAVEKGDWLKWQELHIAPPAQPVTRLRSLDKWGGKPGTWVIGPDGVAQCASGNKIECDRDVLWNRSVEPWIKLRDSGVGVMVGEWGCHNRTPHPVALAWMRDCLANWQRANFGWALWNLRGSFGVLDSERKDVAYENFRGHKLDRQMLELLRAG